MHYIELLSEPIRDCRLKIIEELAAQIYADFDDGKYIIFPVPMMDEFCIETEGGICELEASGNILPENVRAFRRAREKIMFMYEAGMRGDYEYCQIMYLLSADASSWIPVTLGLAFIYDEERNTAHEAIGTIQLARNIPAMERIA